jgi:hypothetical protein
MGVSAVFVMGPGLNNLFSMVFEIGEKKGVGGGCS